VAGEASLTGIMPPPDDKDSPAFLPLLPFLIVWTVVVLVLVGSGSDQPRTPSYGEFLGQLEAGSVEKVTIKPQRNAVEVKPRSGRTYRTAYPDNTEAELINKLQRHCVAIDVKPKSSGWAHYLVYLAPFALVAAVWVVLLRRSTGASTRAARMTRSPARRADPDRPQSHVPRCGGGG
jgi:ATP-dependent Zn protease